MTASGRLLLEFEIPGSCHMFMPIGQVECDFALSGVEEIDCFFMRSRGIASRVIEILFGRQDAGRGATTV